MGLLVVDAAREPLDAVGPADVEVLEPVLLGVPQDDRPELLPLADRHCGGMPPGLLGKGGRVRPSHHDFPATGEESIGDLVGDPGAGSANGVGD